MKDSFFFILYFYPFLISSFHNKSSILSHLQEVPGVTISALEEMSVSLLRQKSGNVARDLNIEAIENGLDQLRPAGGDNTRKKRKN